MWSIGIWKPIDRKFGLRPWLRKSITTRCGLMLSLGMGFDRPKTRCAKCTPMCASARVAPSNIVYQWYGYRSTRTGVLTTKILLLR